MRGGSPTGLCPIGAALGLAVGLGFRGSVAPVADQGGAAH